MTATAPAIPQPPPPTRKPRGDILVTAFEPSGDDHAAVLIAELKRRHPDLTIHALGGPKMEAAGAHLIERTGEDAVMGVPTLDKVREHRAINTRIAAWLDANPIAMHIPVDSPAANFPICRLAKKRNITVCHLVAPQVWAWATWRIRKLRRLSDLVLCVLPFEERWFRDRNVNARFVGHPLFTHPLDTEALDAQASDLPTRKPRLALLPGSRPAELSRNFPLLLDSFRRLRQDRPNLEGVVAATTQPVADHLRTLADTTGGWPDRLHIVSGKTDAVLHWADLALVTSGTVTLQVARHRPPMAIVYKSQSPMLYMVLQPLLFATEFFTLPNLIAAREVVPEFVPHFEGHEPLTAAAARLLDDPEAAATQRAELESIVQQFTAHNAATEAADAIEPLLLEPAH